MSVENIVVFNKSCKLSPQLLVEKMQGAGFDVELNGEFDFDDFEGYAAFKLDGVETGFELYIGELDDEFFEPEDQKYVGERTQAAVFVTYTDYREYKCSLIASAAMAELTDGLFLEGGEPPIIYPNEAMQWIKDCMPEIEDKIK
ncbi:MAG: hypothetical protein D6B28_08075 [Gammaproteobacteria bacterium]|nr:MAG: hypothetical protein D6B28_08075 [Gammaproteobacteria bacterium]